MPAYASRDIAARGRHVPQDFLQSIFVCEMMAPSDPLWIVSPWISDVEVQLAVELGAVAMPLGALAELAAGTLLPLATTESTPLPVYVEGVQRFHARPQALEDGRVIVTLVDPESP